MKKIDEIRRNNADIYKKIKVIIEANNGDVPKDIMEKILTLEQRNVVASYLAMYDYVNCHKDILEEGKLGDVQISITCDSGLNHKTNAVIIKDMSTIVNGIRKEKEYGTNKNADKNAVIDMPSYIQYFKESGGTELNFYLTTLPHEARHMMGVEGNSGFAEAKGFAEGKNELDTRTAMEYFGFEYYCNRNYSIEVSFVKALEVLTDKQSVDEVGYYKPIEYAKLREKFGPNFDGFLKLKDQNSIKKDVRLSFEREGKIDVKKDSVEYKERAANIKEERKKEIDEFKKRTGIDDKTYQEMETEYANVENSRNERYKALIGRIPLEIRAAVERVAKKFDTIHLMSNPNEMVLAYNDVSLGDIEDYIKNNNLKREESIFSMDDSKLDTILQIQKKELEELNMIYELMDPNRSVMTTADVKIANNPNIVDNIVIASKYNSEIAEDIEKTSKESETIQR